MALSAIFRKPIDRPIEGVIKADDEASLGLEVEEYVVTNEIAKRLEDFLGAYTHYEGANGVWISGFFGSGKSHLLKMLALLLEDRDIKGKRVLDSFLEKNRVGDNALLRGDMKKAVAVPSQSILFNIDQKADVIAKTEFDALLAVFVKVFDEMSGYYGKQGHIAQFERDLDSRDQYDAFKQAYRQVSGKGWERGREQALLERRNIAQAYAQATGAQPEDADDILDKYRADYRVSIEDFAEQVQAYIETQGPAFRLNFFVDEVGQYIADNVKLMTNLQTIAESLATKSRGRAWIVVTAQEDMSDVVGEMDKQQGTDFSKIQARFGTRMKLTSANVADVIGERLLSKNDLGFDLLSTVYAEQQNNFKTLFDFADGGQGYRNFRDRDQFIRNYPFIPYQFVLFQSAIQSLSDHNAFEGRHRSVGERSMLGVFQHVAMQIADYEVGQLATFDLMFEGISKTLKSQIQHSVVTAEQHLDDPFAVRVLKAIFLVKYIKEFKATPRNITVLMTDRFDIDLEALRQKVEAALNLLEQQSYIQRNGEEYEYLTDEEKDIEVEIKNTDVDTVAVADKLGELVFDTVIKVRKIRYDENGQDYPFSRKLDDRLRGREQELAIHVISPFHEHAGNDMILRAQSMGRDELLMIMPPDDRLMRDLLMYSRTEKYIRQNITTTQQDSIRTILTEKRIQNGNRDRGLRELVHELLGQAKLIVNGTDVEVSGSDPRTRIEAGFHELLVRTYPNLRMLRGINYTEKDIANCLLAQVTLLGDDAATFSEAEQEMLAHIQSDSRNGLRTTLQSLVRRFERKPYGWHLAAIQCTLAKLCARGKIEVKRDGNILDENQELQQALTNTHGYGNVVLNPQIDFTASQVRGLKEFCAEFFDGPLLANEARALGQETEKAFYDLEAELSELQRQLNRYPFLAALDEPVQRLQAVTGKPYTFYLTELRAHEDALFEMKEQVLDPVRRFMSGSQKQIYDDAQQFLYGQDANFYYIDGGEAGQIRNILHDPACVRSNRMAQVKSLLHGLQGKVESQLAAEKEEAGWALDERWQRLAGMAEFDDLTPERQSQLLQPFEERKRDIERQTLIAVIRDSIRRFDDNEYQNLLGKMTLWAQPALEITPEDGVEATEGDSSALRDKPVEVVPRSSIVVPFTKVWLADEADVDAYVEALKQALMQAIAEGKRVQI
ncbi:MAG: BREX system P-loop protein BrxC [Chloroflexi bacterium]|nr:BREX system P-loop protein BrxC [Chloroflexota bacterium]